MIFEWAGNSPAWFLIEVCVFIFYIVSMVILILKSRFLQVGIDQSLQFEEVYMSKLIQRIIENMDFDLLQEKRSHAATKKLFTKYKNKVEVNSVNIIVKMTEAGFNRVFENLILGNKEVVPPAEAHSWVLENLVGDITKEKLE